MTSLEKRYDLPSEANFAFTLINIHYYSLTLFCDDKDKPIGCTM